MAVTTKKLFAATSNATTTVFSPVSIQLNNQDDLDVYVTLSGGTRVLQLRQSTGSTAQSSHPQVNNTDGLYFPAVSAGTTLYNYQLSTDNNTITFNSALPQGAVVFCERRTRDADSSYTSFASGSTIRATDLNNSSTESNFTAQDGRNKALEIEGVLFRGDQPSTNFVTTDHIVNGTIVTADIANDSVTADKIPDDTINSEHYVAQSIDTEHIALENITTALLAPDAVTSAKLADNAVNSEHYVDGSIDREHLAADIVDGTKIADDSIDSEHYVDLSIDTQHIGNLQITTGKIADGAITDAKIAGGSLDNRYYTETELDAGQLDNRYYTETESDARYFNVSTGDTIKDGDTFPDNDTTIATTAAINDRIIDLVDDVGGFVPIANETSFPTSNPDVNNGTGTIVSVSAASTNLAPSGTTVTIANGRGSGLAVIITGVSATIPSGFGFLVETTTTAHTYTFHRLSPKATEVTTVSGIASNVTTVAGIASNVTTVANNDSNITAVAGNNSNITAVAGNATNINAVAADASDIGIVAADGTDIGLVAGSIANVNTAATNIASINNASANISSVNNFGDKYQVASSDPSQDGGGNDLAEGDLYFNTTADELKVYNGGAWQGGVTASGNFASKTGNTFTGTNIHNDNVKSVYGTSSDGLEIFHNGSDSVINDTGTGALKLQRGGATKISLESGGIDITGNIVVSGNVDGRDVAADGNKLDGIATGATAFANVVEDTTPQLGGDLDVQSSKITTATSNGNVKIEPNGTGVVEVRGAGGNDGTLQLNCSAQSHGIKLKSPPHSAAQSYTLTFPSSIVNNGFLKTDSSGNLSFAAVNTDLSNDTTPQLGGDLQSNGNDIDFADNDKAVFGTGGDLVIQHTGGTSDITNSTSNLNFINNADSAHVNFIHDNEYMLRAASDGAVEAYYDNVKKFETTSAGVSVTGNITVSGTVDGIDIATDVAANTSKVTNATHSGEVTGSTALTIADNVVDEANLKVSNSPSNGYFLSAQSGNTGGLTWAQVTTDLVGDTSPQLGGDLDTNSNHILLNDTAQLKMGASNDFVIRHNGTDNTLGGDATTKFFNPLLEIYKLDGTKKAAAFNPDGATELYHNNSKKFETVSAGVSITGQVSSDTIHVGDGSTGIQVGDSSDLKIYHDGTNNYLRNNNCDLIVQPTSTGETAAVFKDNGSVELYHNNVKKFQTVSGGAEVIGTCTATSFSGDGSNLTGIAAAQGGGSDKIFWENGTNVTQNYTITNGYNAMSAGPIQIDSGVTVTVGSGETWTVV